MRFPARIYDRRGSVLWPRLRSRLKIVVSPALRICYTNDYPMKGGSTRIARNQPHRLRSLGCILASVAFLAGHLHAQSVRPVITMQPQPQNQTVAAGGDATFVVTASGTLPMNYSWRLNGRVFTNITVTENTGIFTIRDVQTNHAGGWRVGITNIAGPANGLSSDAVLTVFFPIVSNSVALLAESCAPANAAIDPGETVTVELGLVNSNAPATSNLIATLEPGNGILLPSGPQLYDGLLLGGPPVARQFTFVADAACGSNFTASLRLWDGTNDLGRVRFAFQVGQTNGDCCYDTATADLALTMSGALSSVQAGSAVEYRISVTNRGPGTATGIQISNPPQAGLNLISATTPSGTCVINDSGVVCNLTDF